MTESPIDVWTQHAIPAGSGRYYALLYSDNPAQIGAILTLISIWSKLCFSNRETSAAKQQIDWWQSELNSDNPGHPVTLQLQRTLTNAQPKQQLRQQLNEVLQGYSALVTDGSPSREAPGRAFHHRTGAVAAIALSNQKPTQATEQVGIALSKFRCIRHIRKHVANGLLCLSYEEMNAAGLSPTKLTPGNYEPKTVNFILARLEAIKVQLDTSLPRLAQESSEAAFLYIYAQLQYRLLHYVRRNIETLEHPDIRLTPLRYFWAARRASHQYRKQSADKALP